MLLIRTYVQRSNGCIPTTTEKELIAKFQIILEMRSEVTINFKAFRDIYDALNDITRALQWIILVVIIYLDRQRLCRFFGLTKPLCAFWVIVK